MIAADRFDRRGGKLLVVSSQGAMRRLPRTALANLFDPGDLVVANDAATLPASLRGAHVESSTPVEARLAAWIAPGDPTRFVAIMFGPGDHRIRTENRPPPPPLAAGARLAFGPLSAVIERVLDHPRLVVLRFLGSREAVFAGLARHGRPIQYAHIAEPLALWDVWTRIAAKPFAFEPPSAGFALEWATLAAWRRRGVGFATLTHAAGISSTGDAALDRRLPFDEPYQIPEQTAAAIAAAKAQGRKVVAIGTSVVRALEAAAEAGAVRAGGGLARGRVGRETRLGIVDALVTGAHQPGESHFELLRAFADETTLERMSAAFIASDFRGHEFGDSVLIERARPLSADWEKGAPTPIAIAK